MVTKADKQRFAKNGYNDKPERDAFIRDMKTDSELKEFIYDYFNSVSYTHLTLPTTPYV